MEAVFALLDHTVTRTLLDHAVRVSDGPLLREIHQCALDEKSTLSSASNEVLLRGYSAFGDSRAVEVSDDMIFVCNLMIREILGKAQLQLQ